MENFMKIAVKGYNGFRGCPEFAVDFGLIEFNEPIITELTNDSAAYMAFSKDSNVLEYRLLRRKAEDGNTHYGYSEGGYLSGWSSRVSVMNNLFGIKFVEAYPYGIRLIAFLELIDRSYKGSVAVRFEAFSEEDMDYTVLPYDNKRIYDDSYSVIDCGNPGWIDQAYLALTGEVL